MTQKSNKDRSPKQGYLHQSLRLPEKYLDKVREVVAVTKQTMTGFVQVAIDEKIDRDKL